MPTSIATTRQMPDFRVGISRKRCRPLIGMLRALPAGVVGGDIFLGAFLERERLGLLNGLRGLESASVIDADQSL